MKKIQIRKEKQKREGKKRKLHRIKNWAKNTEKDKEQEDIKRNKEISGKFMILRPTKRKIKK